MSGVKLAKLDVYLGQIKIKLDECKCICKLCVRSGHNGITETASPE